MRMIRVAQRSPRRAATLARPNWNGREMGGTGTGDGTGGIGAAEEGGMTMERHMLDYRTLLEAGACDWALALFRDLYPEGEAEVSVDNCVAVANRFDWDWAAWNLLPAAAQDEYKRARAAALTEHPTLMYGGADAAALIEYNRAKAAAWAQAWLTRQSLSQPQKSILRLFGHWRLWRERQSAAGPSRDRK